MESLRYTGLLYPFLVMKLHIVYNKLFDYHCIKQIIFNIRFNIFLYFIEQINYDEDEQTVLFIYLFNESNNLKDSLNLY